MELSQAGAGLRARLLDIAATLVRRSRHRVLHLAQHAPEARTVLTGINRLRTAVAQTRPGETTRPYDQQDVPSREWNPTARN